MAAVSETLRLALREHQSGRLPQAEQMYRQILRLDPRHADALHLLGVVEHQTGRHEAAVDSIRRAIASNRRVAAFHANLGTAYHALGKLDEAVESYRCALGIEPANAESHNNLGNTLKAQGKIDEAIASYQRALGINPQYAKAHYNLANALAGQRRFDEAVVGYRRVLEIAPGFVEAHYNLGIALEAQDRLDDAAVSYQRALEIRPDYIEAHNNLGNVLENQGKLDAAAASYRVALSVQPDYAEAHNNLGTVFKTRGMLEEAVACYRCALNIKPDYAEAHNNLGNALKSQGKLDKATASFRRALTLRPDRALWELRVAAICPVVPQSSQQIDRYRRKLLADLKSFSARDLSIDLSELSTSGAEPPLGLMYHGRNDRPIKEAYANVFRNGFPKETPTVRQGLPRIGFVVTGQHESIFLWFMGGVLEHWNSGLFDVFIVCSQAGAAKIRAAIRNPSIQILAIPNRFDRIVKVIRAAHFDLLYYWEVGTDSINYFLPFCRLASVQCTSGGIPVTSGIPEMDYYLSNELWETEDSDDHYSESLIRTKTSLVCPRRVALSEAPRTRESFGLAADQHLYLCAQKMEKFHPDFDPILAGILRRDGLGVVVLVEDRHRYAARALGARFAATMADVVDRIVFLPRQTYLDYLGLVAASDVLLDTLYYCGGSTTYQGLSLGAPIVTQPTRFQAGRSTLACYRKMEIDDCIALHPEEYVEIAVRLGTDVDYRAEVSGRISTRSALLFENLEAVRELERVFEQLIQEARSR